MKLESVSSNKENKIILPNATTEKLANYMMGITKSTLSEVPIRSRSEGTSCRLTFAESNTAPSALPHVMSNPMKNNMYGTLIQVKQADDP